MRVRLCFQTSAAAPLGCSACLLGAQKMKRGCVEQIEGADGEFP